MSLCQVTTSIVVLGSSIDGFSWSMIQMSNSNAISNNKSM